MDKDNVDKDAFDNLKRCLKKVRVKYYVFNNIKDYSKGIDKAKKIYKDNGCCCLIGFGSSNALEYAYKFSSNISARDLLDHYNECTWNSCYNTFRNKYIKGLITKFYKNFTYDLREE